ncbi:hypothetical protein A5656_24335 [Mycobacterium gordonae]|uniref:TetR/AcrR family transcriptional regulator n=1 Tax=Mycobacterium paragordonae TaxID=1389713 RepID=UPI0007F02674|nr:MULTISPECIES: TetR/AcrR family transcriptional regulator [Mycobacterium]OBK52715.1 hypothetical protein A5656_24335 [Mycobacterium gordonae]
MPRQYRGRVAEARTAERRERLVRAGTELAGRHGVAAMTMRAVCREAALSQRFFYESFDDTEQLLQAVYLHALDIVKEEIRASSPDTLDSRLRVRAGVDAVAQLSRNDTRLCRILLIEPIADLRLRRLVRTALSGLTDSAAADLPAVKMQYATMFGAIISLFIEWTEGNLGDDRCAFVDHVTDLLLASPLAANFR